MYRLNPMVSSQLPTSLSSRPKNVLGGDLQCCCLTPRTGFYRDGFCQTDAMDYGRHTVCAQVTQAFLEFSRAQGNDLITPRPEYEFPGLKPGDRWCLCVSRWRDAYDAGCAPPVVLEACHAKALEVASLAALTAHRLT
jgi:uncharacterized protein